MVYVVKYFRNNQQDTGKSGFLGEKQDDQSYTEVFCRGAAFTVTTHN